MSSARYFKSASVTVKCSLSQVPVSAPVSWRPCVCAADDANLEIENAAVVVKHLGFGNVGVGVKIEPVAGRAVRLVARDETVLVRPVNPRRLGLLAP